ncbi:MAG: LPS-assembly protein LptD [Thermoanaerobaculia bacterium]
MGQTDPYESRFRTHPNFQIRFRAPEKGGEVRLYTKNPVRYEKDVSWEGSEEVSIEYQDVKISADRARYDFASKTATLEGHVVIDQGPTRLSGERAVFDLERKTGTIERASATLPPSYHILADAIDKIGEATYRVHRGLFTACDVPEPDWSFFMTEATVTLDDYARMKNVSFRARELPLLYTPYMIWPTKEGRVSGMLVPGVGYTQRRGAYLGLSHYWVTGQSTDLTTQVDLFSEGTVGVGEEFRWAPSPQSAGIFQGYFVHDAEATTCVPLSEGEAGSPCTLPDGSLGVLTLRTRNRWKVRLDHVSEDLPWGLRGVVAIRDYSDEQYLQDFERSFTYASLAEILSRAFLTKNAGVNSLNLRLERSETFLGATVLQERLPTLEYFRRTSELARTPFFLSVQASLSNLFVNRGKRFLHGGYGRADVHPVISLPWKGVPWLSATASAGGRWTGYTDSTNALQTEFTGSSASRAYGEAGLALVGPSFSRVYEGQIGPFGKFKHVIEPRVDYRWISRVEEPERVPLFDDIDTVLGQNQIRYALVNRLLARAADPKAGAASEIASLEIAQSYAFEPPQTRFGDAPGFRKAGPLEAALRFAPGALVSFDGRLAWDTKSGQVISNTVAASVAWKSSFFNATWFSSRPVLTTPLPPGAPSPNADQLRFAAGVDVAGPFRIDAEVNYDVQQGTVLENRSLLTYRGSCYALFLEFRQLRLPGNERNDVRFVVNLKDIGTLLDLNGALKAGLF